MSEELYVKHSRYGVITIPNNPSVVYNTDINEWCLQRVQSVAIGGDMPTIEFKEFGRAGKKKIASVSSVPVSIKFNEFGKIKHWALFSGQDPDTTQEVMAGADPDDGSDGDFTNETCDFVAMKKNSAGTIIEGVFVQRVAVGGFDITIPSGNEKMEVTVNGTGRAKSWVANTSKYVVRESHDVTNTDDTNGYFDCALEATALDHPSGKYTLRVSKVAKVSGVVDLSTQVDLVEGTDYTCSIVSNKLRLTEAGTNTWDYTGATTYEIVAVTYTVSSDAGNANICSFANVDDTNPYLITGKQIETFIVSDGNLATIKAAIYGSQISAIANVYRVKASNVSVSFSREDLYQQGDENTFARPSNDATATMTLDKFETDLTTLAILTGTSAATVKSLRLSDFLTNLNVVVVIYDDADHTNILARYIMEDIRVSGQSMDGDVGSVFNAGFTIEADNFYVYDTGLGS